MPWPAVIVGIMLLSW